jgi:hypothetical protein
MKSDIGGLTLGPVAPLPKGRGFDSLKVFEKAYQELTAKRQKQ